MRYKLLKASIGEIKTMGKTQVKKVAEAINRAVDYLEGDQVTLASALGVSKSLISHWKSGQTKVSIKKARDIEKVTGAAVTVEDLIPYLHNRYD